MPRRPIVTVFRRLYAGQFYYWYYAGSREDRCEVSERLALNWAGLGQCRIKTVE